MQRLFWLVLVLVMALGPSESRAQSQYSDGNFFNVYFLNKCNRDIQVAIHYVDLSGRWITNGWWTLAPGEQAFVARTKNRIFYHYAESIGPPSDRLFWRGAAQYYSIRGSSNTYGFIQRSMTMDNWGTWTESYTCY